MGWIGYVRREKFRRDFLLRTFALIAQVHLVLHRVSCSYETIPNAHKHYATHQNMSLGSNRVDWVRSLRKISTWLHGTSLCINCTSSHCFASSFMQLRNDPKCIQILRNGRNISLGCNGVDWLHSLRKIPSWLRGTKFCMNWTSLVCFATSFMQLRNDPKCTQRQQNRPNH